MKQTTLCYIEENGAYLMLHRTKKINDENHDKWVGIGGKLEEVETPFECIRREVKEEVGVSAVNLRYRGLITFVSDIYGTEYMHLFSAHGYEGTLFKECDEGEPKFVEKTKVADLPIWEGDKIFLKLLDTEDRFFSLKLVYRGDALIDHTLEY